jgi:hypothetical protein
VKRVLAKKYWRLEVEWVDSHTGGNGWQPVHEYLRKKHRRPMLTSVGYLLADDKKGVVLANSVDPNYNNAAEVISIPIEAIIRRRRLR